VARRLQCVCSIKTYRCLAAAVIRYVCAAAIERGWSAACDRDDVDEARCSDDLALRWVVSLADTHTSSYAFISGCSRCRIHCYFWKGAIAKKTKQMANRWRFVISEHTYKDSNNWVDSGTTWMLNVDYRRDRSYRRLRKTGNEGEGATRCDRAFHTLTGKARSATVERRVRRTRRDVDEAQRSWCRASELADWCSLSARYDGPVRCLSKPNRSLASEMMKMTFNSARSPDQVVETMTGP